MNRKLTPVVVTTPLVKPIGIESNVLPGGSYTHVENRPAVAMLRRGVVEKSTGRIDHRVAAGHGLVVLGNKLNPGPHKPLMSRHKASKGQLIFRRDDGVDLQSNVVGL